MSVSAVFSPAWGIFKRQMLVYSLPGAHNCPTIWAGARVALKKRLGGTRLPPLMWEASRLYRRRPQSQGSARCIGVRETPCQEEELRLTCWTQTMVWNRGGAIWRGMERPEG